MKYLILFTIILSLITNSFAVTISPTFQSENLSLIANTLNGSSHTYKDLIKIAQKTDPSRAKEIDIFYTTHPEYHAASMPQFTVEDNKLVFWVGSEKVNISLEKDGGVVTVGKKIIFLKYTLSVEQMAKVLNGTLTVKDFAFINIFINNAHAFSAEMTTILILGLVGIYVTRKVNLALQFKDYVHETVKWCNKFESVPSSPEILEIYTDTYNRLAEKFVDICVPGEFVLTSKGYDKEACEALPEVKRCIKRKIDQKVTSVDNSSRTSKKEVHYDEKEDRYFSIVKEK